MRWAYEAGRLKAARGVGRGDGAASGLSVFGRCCREIKLETGREKFGGEERRWRFF